MKKIFSKDRMLLLFRSLLIQNKAEDMWLFIIVLGIFVLVGLGQYPAINYQILPVANFLIMIVLAAPAFSKLNFAPHAISYLTLPASTAEKTVVTIVYLQYYYLIALCTCSLVGFYLGQILQNLLVMVPFFQQLFPDYLSNRMLYSNFALSSVSFAGFGSRLLGLHILLSIMLFGSVYFKKYAILKTPLVIFGFILLNMMVAAIVLALANGFAHENYPGASVQISVSWQEFVTCTSGILITLFFWFMTYLRLRETEV